VVKLAVAICFRSIRLAPGSSMFNPHSKNLDFNTNVPTFPADALQNLLFAWAVDLEWWVRCWGHVTKSEAYGVGHPQRSLLEFLTRLVLQHRQSFVKSRCYSRCGRRFLFWCEVNCTRRVNSSYCCLTNPQGPLRREIMRFRSVGDQTPCGSIQAREQCVLVGVAKRRLKRWCDTGLSQRDCDGNLRADIIAA
jgi:hypothetical protein